MLALSERSSYEGGGTDFDCLDEVLHLEQGELVLFDASMYHAGVPITTGLRYLLVGFCHTKISAMRAVGNLNLNLDPIYGNRNSFELWHMKRFEEQSQHLLDAVRDLGMRQEAHMLSPSSSWIGCNEDTTCSIASFAKRVFWFHVKRLELEHTMDGGCEFWTQILDCDPEASDALDSIPWYERHSYTVHVLLHVVRVEVSVPIVSLIRHQDKDEEAFQKSQGGIVRHPVVASVTYLTTDGIPTCVFGEHGCFVSYPKHGNHLAFG
jgi:hypothetical protein